MSELPTIIKTIRKVFVLPQSEIPKIAQLWKRATNKTLPQDRAIQEFIGILKSLKVMPTTQAKSSYKSSSAIELLGDYRPKSVLDIGAGRGIIVQAMGEHYGLDRSAIFGIDLQEIGNPNITVLKYGENGQIPLPDGSVDVIILMSVLHHIPPDSRKLVMAEITRVLAPDGRVVIREHDGDGTFTFWMFLEFVHYVWYVAYDEHYDPLHLLSKQELIQLFAEFGLTQIAEKNVNGQNPQRMYESIFERS